MEIRSLILADASAVHALTRRWEIHWDVPLVTPLAEIESDLSAPFVDLGEQTRSYLDADRLAAFGRVSFRPSGQILERAYLIGMVDPGYRGRGIGRELFGWQKDKATSILSAVDNDLPKYIRTNEWDWIDESHRMYRRFGLEPVRYFTEMLRSLGAAEPVDVPNGVDIVGYDRALDEVAMDVINRSFADHWGSTPTDIDSFRHRLEGPGTLLDASFLAVAGEEVIGISLNGHYPDDEALLGRRDGWIEVLGVTREWRKRGVATALLQTSFNAFRDMGLTHSAIGVDTDNPTDALRLYTGLGYEPTHRSITSELRIGDEPAE